MFNTEEQTDFVEIFRGGRTLSKSDLVPIAKLSGEPDLATYFSDNNYMIVTFMSDSENQSPGFQIEFTECKLE